MTFTQSAAVITSTAGAGGTIAPLGNQTVPINGSQNYTITPNNGYSILDVKVDNVSVGAVSSYTFTDVTANHTIDATFAANTPSSINVTTPTGDVTYAPGDLLPVTWSVSPTIAVGEFSIWVRSTAGLYYGGKVVAATPGNSNYSGGLRLNVPRDTGYVVYVYYRATSGDPWGVFGQGTGTLNVADMIDVTSPTGTPVMPQGAFLPVNWTTSQIVSSGQFSIWAMSAQGLFYGGTIVPADPGTMDYAGHLKLDIPTDTGYRIFVYYRATSADPWGVYGQSPGTVDVIVSNLISVTAPSTPVSQVQGTSLQVDWTTSQLVLGGEFSIWVRSSGGLYYGGKITGVNPSSQIYGDTLSLDAPVGVGYTVYVYYRANPTDPWGVYGQSSGLLTIL